MKKPLPSSSDRSRMLRRINVLLLDGDPRMLEIEKNVLGDLGFSKIFMGRDGEDGLRIMENNPISLVITDWNMRPMDGIEFIRRVRGRTDSPDCRVPIILLTAQAEPEDVRTARDSGITEFVVKPFTVKRLIDRIIEIINNPRSFILAPNFKGHDRRRRGDPPPPGKAEQRKKRKGA
jgi:DNA-binding response OmpR family regulator